MSFICFLLLWFPLFNIIISQTFSFMIYFMLLYISKFNTFLFYEYNTEEKYHQIQ